MGALLRLAERYDATRILQVAYYRTTSWPRLRIDGDLCTVPETVISHFRDCSTVAGLKMRDRKDLRIEVVLSLFSDRKNYHKEVLSRLGELAEGPSIIFLDPDTGLAPANPGYEHVLNDELAAIWAAIRFSDVLAIYQHQTNRRGEPWIDAKRSQMEEALKLPVGAVRVVVAEDPEQRRAGAAAPKNVALLFSHKTRTLAALVGAARVRG